MVVLTRKDDPFYEEGLVVTSHKVVTFEDDDAALVSAVDQWVKDGSEVMKEVLKKAKKNKKYYLGDQLEESKMKRGQSKVIVNKVWQSVETMVPVAAANIPAPICTLPEVEDKGEQIDLRTSARALEEVELAIAQENRVDHIFKETLRLHEIYHLGVIGYKYCDKSSSIKVWVDKPWEFLLPPDGSDDWVIKRCLKTWGEISEGLSEAEKKAFETLLSPGQTAASSSLLAFFEVYTPQFTFYKCKTVIWGKKKNVNWNEEGGNHWVEPKIPFIFTDMWTLASGKLALTTNLEQILPLQDAVNARKIQINENARHSNGMLVGFEDSGATRTDAAELERKRGEPNSVAFVKGNQGAYTEYKGRDLQPFVFEDMAHSISEIDNVFGTHSNIRGEKTPGEESGRGRQLLIGGDETRIGELGGMVDRMAQELYNAFAQLIKVHFKKAHWSAYIGRDGASKQVKIEAAIVKQGLKVTVRTGSSIRKDEVAQASQAVELWRLGALDPVSLFERLNFPNPAQSAERLMKFKTDPQGYFPEVKKEYMQAMNSDRQQGILNAVTRSLIENRALASGQAVAPFKGANIQHLWGHMEVMQSPDFLQLGPEVIKAFKEHVMAETEIARENLKGEVGEKEKQQLEILSTLTGPDERS